MNMFGDEKIKLIKTMPEGDKIIVIWVQLLCLAGCFFVGKNKFGKINIKLLLRVVGCGRM